jgi:hypothetical protein
MAWYLVEHRDVTYIFFYVSFLCYICSSRNKPCHPLTLLCSTEVIDGIDSSLETRWQRVARITRMGTVCSILYYKQVFQLLEENI